MDFKEIENMGKQYGLTIHASYGGIFIKSPKGNWRLEIIDNNNINLYHESNFKIGKAGNFEYHYHFQKKFMNIKNSLEYIKSHDHIRYTQNEKSERIFNKILEDKENEDMCLE